MAEIRALVEEYRRETPGEYQRAVARSIEDRAEHDVPWLVDHVAALSQRVRELEEATNGIADYGWTFDGRLTFTVNCTTQADARRLQELLQQRLP